MVLNEKPRSETADFSDMSGGIHRPSCTGQIALKA